MNILLIEEKRSQEAYRMLLDVRPILRWCRTTSNPQEIKESVERYFCELQKLLETCHSIAFLEVAIISRGILRTICGNTLHFHVQFGNYYCPTVLTTSRYVVN